MDDHLKFTVCQVLTEQRRLSDLCLRENENQIWPDDEPKWRRTEGDADEDHVARCRAMNELATRANRFWPLHELRIDHCLALIRVVATAEQSLLQNGVRVGDVCVLMGEVAQAQGHLMAFSLRLQKMCAMIHTENFELVPPSFA